MDVADEYLGQVRRARWRRLLTVVALLVAPVPGFLLGAMGSSFLFGDYAGKSLLVFGVIGAVVTTAGAFCLARILTRA